jgi:hypothetical protein
VSCWYDWRMTVIWLMAVGIASTFGRRHASSNSLGDQLGRSRFESRICPTSGEVKLAPLRAAVSLTPKILALTRCSVPYAGYSCVPSRLGCKNTACC